MKKFTLCITAVLLLITFNPMQINAQAPKASNAIEANPVAEEAEARGLLYRLDEIRQMDKSKLSSAEKGNLRSEIKAKKKKLKQINGGVYLSTGAIILIIILLIILL
ncbi:MAG: hypothetical protein SGJ10_06660 [Bacteroidota bacterium]|nr:hypothetical protein [Bacteroidota bacterium]